MTVSHGLYLPQLKLMTNKHSSFDSVQALKHLKHFLPAQAPLKDFIHHNTLHAFQDMNFHAGLHEASRKFGYQVYLNLKEYRAYFNQGQISEKILDRCILKHGSPHRSLDEWKDRLLISLHDETLHQRVGNLRQNWKSVFHVNIDKYVHPKLFRYLGSFLDQGIGIMGFPGKDLRFLDAIRVIDRESYIPVFQSKRCRELLQCETLTINQLLNFLVAEESLYERYLIDQQFAHPGWSGMVSVLEEKSESLLDRRQITLEEVILFELLLELDVLDDRLGKSWKPLGSVVKREEVGNFFEKEPEEDLFTLYKIWQEAYEWTYYDQVIRGLQEAHDESITENYTFQAVFCIDDRECSFRRHLEKYDPACQTYSTAGFFNVAFYFQPEHGKFYTKSCPAPLNPGHLIREKEAGKRHKTDSVFNRHTHGFFGGLLTAPTLGFWTALKMAGNILRPTESPAMVSSFRHMDPNGILGIEADALLEKNLRVGFTIEEMIERVQGLLVGIGLTSNFAPLVYFIGHGASSLNNTHYAGYDCGACSGRAGSVNARVAAYMANHPAVREGLIALGIYIPEGTQFLGGLHDTTRDEVQFYDEEILTDSNAGFHQENINCFKSSLCANARERSRRFLMIDSEKGLENIHLQVKKRSYSLFEPRPEWNHATNALCLIGKRSSNKHLFLDRRAFLNSYDAKLDADGNILLGILNAVAPVCGGINLEYYFSRIDNYRLGAGSKLPHNVMGLIGVANGMDGDLRPGLPMQMVNIHDPVRLLICIEHDPDEVLRIIQLNPATFEWFKNQWIHLAVIHPGSRKAFVYSDNQFVLYEPATEKIECMPANSDLFARESGNLPVYLNGDGK